MNKLNIIQKVFEVIQESLPVPDGTINDNYDGSKVDSRPATLTDDTVNEQEIKELCEDFAKAINDRDVAYLDGRAEYHLYTVDHLIRLIRTNDEQNTLKVLNENRIKSKYEDCEFFSINFSADHEEAEVIYVVRTSVISADDKYFKQLNKKNNKNDRIKPGTPYSTKYTLLVKKEKGTWKIDKFVASQEI